MKRDTIKNAGKLWRASVSSHSVFNKCIKTEFRQRDVSPLRHWTVFFDLREVGTSLNRTVTKMSLVPHYLIFLMWCKRVSRDCLVCKITDMYCIVTRVTLETGRTLFYEFDFFIAVNSRLAQGPSHIGQSAKFTIGLQAVLTWEWVQPYLCSPYVFKYRNSPAWLRWLKVVMWNNNAGWAWMWHTFCISAWCGDWSIPPSAGATGPWYLQF